MKLCYVKRNMSEFGENIWGKKFFFFSQKFLILYKQRNLIKKLMIDNAVCILFNLKIFLAL